MAQPLWRIVWRFLKKLKIELPYDPAISIMAKYLEKTIIPKDTCTPMFTWGIGLDYGDIEWFALETNRDHSVVFEIASE